MVQQRHHSMFNMMPADVFLTRLYQEQESDGEGRGDGEGGEVLEGLRVGQTALSPICLPPTPPYSMAQQRHHSMFNMMPADVFLTRLYQEQESDGEGRGDGEGGEVLEGLRVGQTVSSFLPSSISDPDTMARQQPHFMNYMTLADVFLTRP
ncbi:hypothetical protein O3P69_013226 [Scylla paramamosain]|uniref:Uncharacterized protein n=1 Tax=Scylla paramamosain TaxID=85552 RepID=A0AAW0U2N3_SCYPA